MNAITGHTNKTAGHLLRAVTSAFCNQGKTVLRMIWQLPEQAEDISQ